jgi:hypothetical protein
MYRMSGYRRCAPREDAGQREYRSWRSYVPLFLLPSPYSISHTNTDIADVTHFVAPDNAMDHEAASRGTTVYLVDKRIDMLPSLLGTNLCSLKEGVERLAFSVIWVRSLSPFSVRIGNAHESIIGDEAEC